VSSHTDLLDSTDIYVDVKAKICSELGLVFASFIANVETCYSKVAWGMKALKGPEASDKIYWCRGIGRVKVAWMVVGADGSAAVVAGAVRRAVVEAKVLRFP